MDEDFSKSTGGGGQQSSLAANGIDDDEEFCPPENFAIVEPGIYRSAFPMRRNFSYLARIGLRSILTLILEEYPEANTEFNKQNGVKLFQFGLEGNKEPFRSMPLDKACEALRALMDPRNHPILVHCNEGKHRTGCVVAMLRRCRGWALSSTLDEYILYAQSKARIIDQRFIELFDPASIGGGEECSPFRVSTEAEAALAASKSTEAENRPIDETANNSEACVAGRGA
eukprot:CAMPEP_0172610504 /NCGR_PEP_ID=MMETSP1068-20121228/30308_1 /TAXON_ID=35684 /ORGANISM="Pseudopedinella elastica, Strain CCMP716" /LENGTH=227 /DNA_ID=CAMNT_0013414237 /DNA_START=184 /DNA_END=867 /DNA_ORIENTATION=-